ncbi:uncharacterized protein LOC142226145 [Haematobia irritans]|uniref:uncharacterized protein LOC142226145 n=1 Tax=Haematobia irritans TaxID=7368 RepID=UPI003F50848D
MDASEYLEESKHDSLTAVWYSPSSKTKANADSNVLACRARLEVIINTTLEHFKKWNMADKRGLQLCSHIEATKGKLLEQINSSEKNEDFTLYPSTLKPHCANLAIIASICNDISVKTKDSLRQLRALSKLPGSCNEIFYRSWQLPNFVTFMEDLATRYENEANIKKAVAENIPHCTSKSELIRWTSLWEYPQYVDSYVFALFTCFKEEIENKNVS